MGYEYTYLGIRFLPAILGFDVDDSQIVIAPCVNVGWAWSRRVPQSTVVREGAITEAGLLLGFDLALDRIFHLMPELGIFVRGSSQGDLISALNDNPVVI